MNGKQASGPSTSMRLLLGTVYGAAALLPAGAAMLSPAWERQDAHGKLTAALLLIVLSLLSLQPVLAARLRLLDRQFGLDMVYVFHKTMGMTASLVQVSALAFFLAAPDRAVPAAVWATAVFMVAISLTAFLHRELRMTYESWRLLHNLLFLVAFAAALAQAGGVISRLGNAPLTLLAGAQVLLGAAAYAHHRFLGPLRRRRQLFRVGSVAVEARNVWTVTFEAPENDRPFDYLPGQFQFVTFDRGRGEEHPFTIASSPANAGTHASTIKASGDFTRTIGALRPGDLVGIQAAFGRFSYVLGPDGRQLVFIAGGIGITPFMSMLRSMRDRGEERDVVLFYANRSEEDIAFRKELDSIEALAAPRLRVIHVLEAPGADWRGERGRIDRPMIEQYTGGLQGKVFYLCGPPPMMNALAAMLIDAGVASRHVRTERFAL
jgi:predicted ferric reductase